MDADDSKCWGLFENRPAKERTASPRSTELPDRGSDRERLGWANLLPAPRSIARSERIKC